MVLVSATCVRGSNIGTQFSSAPLWRACANSVSLRAQIVEPGLPAAGPGKLPSR